MSKIRLLHALVTGCLTLSMGGGDAVAHKCDNFETEPGQVESWLIRQHPDVLLFCAPCGDKVPTPLYVAKLRWVEGNAHPPLIDITDRAGRTRRVATSTVYVKLDPKTRVFTNVRDRATCRVSFEPYTIEWPPSK